MRRLDANDIFMVDFFMDIFTVSANVRIFILVLFVQMPIYRRKLQAKQARQIFGKRSVFAFITHDPLAGKIFKRISDEMCSG